MSVLLLWLRNDLRLADHPALHAALAALHTVVPIYIHAPEEGGAWALGAASRWWLHHSLAALDTALQERGARLVLRHAPSLPALLQLAKECAATEVCFTAAVEPALVAEDAQIAKALAAAGLRCRSFPPNLLYPAGSVLTQAGRPFRVFTPFWRACQSLGPPPAPLPAPRHLPALPSGLESLPLEALGLLPRVAWDRGLRESWQPGEAGALARLAGFLDGPLTVYAVDRDLPALDGSSRLSPHMHFGELSIRQIAWALQPHLDSSRDRQGAESFLRQLGWREFAHHVLQNFPHTPEQPLSPGFAAFPWRRQYQYGDLLRAWRRGRTGYPLVDAGMRQLWQTGWMHNRARMVVASFLTKNCRIPWQCGARWFWNTLVDADLASNTLGWQWSAGCGADAAPYFRIFNPARQGARFDPEGHYLRHWVPELSRLPARWIHEPAAAPESVLREAGIVLGRDYPAPILDFRASRADALVAYEALRGARRPAAGSL